MQNSEWVRADKFSKKLDSIRLKLNVKTIFLVTKAGDESVVDATRKVTRWLLSRDRGVEYVVYIWLSEELQ